MRRILVVNPGHGGRDPGAVGKGGTREAEVAGAVAEEVVRSYRGLRSVAVKQAGSVSEVVERANAFDPALFVSVHMNSSWRRAAQGVQVYHRGDAESERLARLMLAGVGRLLGNVTRWSRVAPARFYVLRKSAAKAAALVEVDFLSNAEVERRCRETWWVSRAAMGIMAGLEAYLGIPK